ncbi:LTA synthase family protein [Clostridium hydrogeniformans]|uniref:LTA synthase family protein n=1 Tax=Clostridium hydrogeniformans TaxID=349933 RepID=UPI00054CFB38|nr:LTA synthase family protein [Clostridium hydrogeniformans]
MNLKPYISTRINTLEKSHIIRGSLFIFTLLSLVIKCAIYLGFTLNENVYSLNFSLGYGQASYFFKYYGAFILCFMCFYFLFKNKGKLWYLIGINFFLTLLILMDLWYFRGFKTVPSLTIVKQTANLDNLSGSIFSMMGFIDLIFVVDIVILLILSIKLRNFYKEGKRKVSLFFLCLILGISYLAYIPFMTNVLKKDVSGSYIYGMYDPNDTVKYFSPIGYHVFNVYQVYKDSKPYNLSDNELEEINTWFDKKKEDLPDNEYKGMYKGKNLIVIQWESLESFVINQKIDGQEITPNLNKLLSKSTYFPHIKEQVNEGTSSDSDLMVNTSMYPLRQGSTFFGYSNNTYNSLPNHLEAMGYSTIGIHPDKGPFWNWMEGLRGIGFDKLVDYYNFNIDETIGLGLSDGSYFKQIVPMLKEQKDPFYSFMVTLTSHGPFDLPEEYKKLNLSKELDENHLGGYFQSINYTDTQLGLFLDSLEKEGILDNSVVVIEGDHTGVHKYYNDKIATLSNQEDWWKEVTWDIPLIIYDKNATEGKQFDLIGGQVDIMPTLLYLMGVPREDFEDSTMGKVLVNSKKNYSVLTNRTVVGEFTEEEKEHAIQGLDLADKLIKSNYFKNYYKK